MTEYSNLNFAAAVEELLTSDWSVKGYQDRCHFSMSLVKICLESFCFCWVFLLLPQSQERFSLLLLSLFCNKRFMLDEMNYQNDSKFAQFVDCYVIVFIVSYREITNSRFSLTQSKPCIF